MRYKIEAREGYLRAEMIERETPQETREFALAAHAAMVEKGISRVVAIVRASRPIFRVEEYQLTELLKLTSGVAEARLALVSDSPEVAAAHQYVELIASQKGIALRAFASEAEAVQWLLRG
jgi:hypothetical protein